MANEGESVTVIRVDQQLKEELRGVHNSDPLLTSHSVDDVGLQGQWVAVRDGPFVQGAKVDDGPALLNSMN